MTDIDFEELDRAVQSAIDDFSEEDSVDQAKGSAVVEKAAVVEPVVEQPAKAPLFTTPRPTHKPVARSLDSFISPKAKVELTPTVKPEIVQPPASKGRMIDSINPVRKKPVREAQTPAPVETVIESVEQVVEPVEVEPIEPFELITHDEQRDSSKESPFIENLKVDKRPLGSLAKDLPEDLPESLPDPVEMLEAPTYIGGVDEAEELPEELQQEILEVEATGMIHRQEPLSGDDINSLDTDQSPDKLAESVYTSDAYTKPLEHPKKNKSGWLKVTLILLLFILGIAGGIAAYYFLI